MCNLQRQKIFGLALSLAIVLGSLGLVEAQVEPPLPPGPAWSAPAAVTIRSLGTTAPDGIGRLAFEDNLDCQRTSYQLNGTGQTQAGCYVSTAFGRLDVGNDLLGFNGNDKTVVPLQPYGPHDTLLPWPGTSSMLALSPALTDGSYISLYRDILNATADQHNLLGEVTAKQVNRPADTPLLDAAGRRLVVNFNSLAFSDGGSWLVAESTSGSFQRINLASLNARPFAPSYTNLGGGFNESQVAISPGGDYVAIANSAAQSIRVYDLTNCGSTINENTVCPSHEYWSAFKAKSGTFQHPMHLRFLNDGALSLIDVSNAGTTTYELSPTAGPFALLDYLALGDSYSSGEGAFAYRAGTDTVDNSCHTSYKGYPALLANDGFTKAGANSVACSGARIFDLLSNPNYTGQARNGVAYSSRPATQVQQYLSGFTPGYLPQASFAAHYQPAAMTVSVGGNDIGFGDLVSLCVAPHFSPHINQANDCFDTYEDRLELARTIDAQVPPLTAAFKKLQTTSPGSTIYAVGYPLIVVDTGSCALNVHLNTGEIAMIIEATKQLNNAIATAAKASGLSYVNIENALAGHRLCEVRSDLVAVNGITAGNDAGVSFGVGPFSANFNFIGQESFHPNAYGYQLIEQEIKRQTHNLQLKLPPPLSKPAAADPSSILLKRPKSGRPVKAKVPTNLIKTKSTKRGGAVTVKTPGLRHGLRPRSPHNISLSNGSSVTMIGVITSDASGNLDGSVSIPSTTIPGTYQVGVDGTDQLGNPISMIDVITVYNSDTDYDGDGLPNTTDSCPTIPNTGVDVDGDGIDDVCDSLIGLPSSTTASGAVGSGSNPPAPTTPAPSTTPPPAMTNSDATVTPVPTEPPALTVIEQLDENAVADLQASPTPAVRGTTKVNALTVSPRQNRPIVLGASTVSNKQLSAASAPVGQSKAQPRTFLSIRRLNWQWLVALYLVCLLILTITKRAQRQLSSLWRRKRDSNPRYP